jgi:hypothetical protein
VEFCGKGESLNAVLCCKEEGSELETPIEDEKEDKVLGRWPWVEGAAADKGRKKIRKDDKIRSPPPAV